MLACASRWMRFQNYGVGSDNGPKDLEIVE